MQVGTTALLNLGVLQRALPQLNSHDLADLEMEIGRKVKHRIKEEFGDQEIALIEGSREYEAFYAALRREPIIQKMLSQYPCTPSGRYFVCSTVTVRVSLYVNYYELFKTYQQTTPGSMFLDAVGKGKDVGPIFHPLFGDFTTENTKFSIRLDPKQPNRPLEPNPNCKELPPKDRHVTRINGPTEVTGHVNRDSALMLGVVKADVSFGKWLNVKGAEFTFETVGVEETTYIVIPLPGKKFNFTRKIYPDGTFTLPSRERRSMDEVNPRGAAWFNRSYTRVIKVVI